MHLILLSITPFGWSTLALILLSVWVSHKFIQRKWQAKQVGCAMKGYVWLVVFIISFIVYTFTGVLVKGVYDMYAKPKYKGIVVSVSSYEDKDSKGHRKTMYTPTVKFNDNNNREVLVETNISSGGKQQIGDIIRVAYASGDTRALDVSGTGIGMMIGMAVMLFIMGYIVFAGYWYAAGKDMKRVFSFGLGILMYFIFPAAMLFFIIALGYVLWGYFMGNRPDMPLWAIIVCGFFVLILSLVLPTYFKMLFAGKGKKGKMIMKASSFRRIR